jgi:tetratricopeptide (TPR) repeat protein
MRGGAPILLLLLAACASTPLEQRTWLEVRSANFTLSSDLPQAQAVALVGDLELFRAVAQKGMSAGRLEPRLPIRIFEFANSGELRPFSPTRWGGAFFESGLRENAMAFDAGGFSRGDARRSLFHEYTHFLLHNQTPVVVPLWYHEGFAMFMQTVRLEDDVVFVGAAPSNRAGALWTDAHDLQTIFRARGFESWDDAQIYVFYLQSWQLVHYFTLGPGKRVKVGTALARYTRLVEQGQDEELAFEAAFGMDFNALWREIRDYNRLNKIPALSIPRSAFAPEPGLEIRALPPAEIAVQLGFLALQMKRPDLAEAYFARALASEPGRSRAHAGIGCVKQLGDRSEDARPHFERALALAPDDFENHLEMAEWLHQRADRQKRVELLPEAREHYQRAIELAPGIPEGHAMLGMTYLLTDEDPAPGIALIERARELLPGDVSTLLPLARLYRRAGRLEDARAFARRASVWSDGEAREEAAGLLQEIEATASQPASR